MTKNRHELPRKRPGRPAKEEIAEDLPTLEPVGDDLPTLQPLDEELPTLEPIAEAPVDDGPVVVTWTVGGEPGFDTVIAVVVPAMEKKDVPVAVKAPLQRALVAAAAAGALRHRKVLVRFGGDAMIGSAVKDLVVGSLEPQKPLLAVVRRGFGDETVAQGKLPEMAMTSREVDGVLRIELTNGDLDPADLPVALAPHLAALRTQVAGKRVGLVFLGKAKPDAALRQQLAASLRAAGALRAAIGERVLFDTELERRVQCTLAGDVVAFTVDDVCDEATATDALATVLPQHAAACKGRTVRFRLGKGARVVRDACVEFARKSGALRVDVGDEIVWPPLVTPVVGAETVLRLQPSGRPPAQQLAALRNEAAAHVAACKGKVVVVDWPAGTVLDDAADACLRDVHTTLGTRALVCTIAGEQREPFVPPPIALASSGDLLTVTLDSEARKPIELQRAIDRRLPARVAELRGKSVLVRVAGGAAISRTLLRGVCTALEAGGVMRLEVEEGGVRDVLLPSLLTVGRTGDTVRIAAITDGREPAQVAKALAREIELAGLTGASTVHVAPSGAADAVAAAVLSKNVARIVLDGPAPVQIHPPLLGAPEKKLQNVRVAVAAGGDDAMVARQLERELGKWSASLGPLANQTATIVWPGADAGSPNVARVLAALVEKRPTKVLLDRGDGKPQQLHPAPAPVAPPAAPPAAPATAPAPSRAASAPGAPAAGGPGAVIVPPPFAAGAADLPTLPLAGGLLQLLARRDDSIPPMVVLGVAAGDAPDHLAAVAAELQDHLPRFRGRSVLLVLRAGEQDVPVRKPDALVDVLRQHVPTTAAATLVFRGPDAQGRPHFQVLHSTLRALPIGATFADPRQRR